MQSFVERVLAVHDALSVAQLPHAVGGGVALSFYTKRPRPARDVDFNVFVAPARAGEALGALPAGAHAGEGRRAEAECDGEARVRWDELTIHLFFDTLRFHERVATSVRRLELAGRSVAVVDPVTLAVFKALADSERHWQDIHAMLDAGTLDVEQATGWVLALDGPASAKAARLRALAAG